MTSSSRTPRRPFSVLEKVILAVHGSVAAVVGIVGVLQANDPGWGDVQRLVIVMLVGLWAGGIVTMAAIARSVNNPWARAGILVGGPFAGIVLVFGRTMLGF